LHALPHQNERPVGGLWRRLSCALAVALAATAAACATSHEPVPPPPPRLLGSDLPAYVAPEPSGTSGDEEFSGDEGPAPEPRGRLRMHDSLAMALLRHPDLAAASWQIRAAEARVLQAGVRPNPELEVEVEEFGGDDDRAGIHAAEITVGLSQEILRAGKLEKRTAVARLEGELAGWDYEATRLDVLTETAKAFTEALAAQERLALMQESVRIGEEVSRVVSRQVQAGKVPPLDENRARVALALHGLERDRVARDLTAKRRALAASWGSSSPQFDELDGSLYDTRPVPAPERVVGLLSQNPDLARWAVEMELHRANVDLQRAEASPDVTIMAGVSHFREDGGESFLAGFAIPLPVFDQNIGGILEARADRNRVREEMRAADVRVRAALSDGYQALAASGQESGTLRDTVLPAAEAAFAAAEKGFRQGKFGYLDVLDAQRTLFDVKQQLIDALAAYHAAVADVERLIGQSLSSIDSTGATDSTGDSVDSHGAPLPQGDRQ